MVNFIIRWCLNNRFLVVLATLVTMAVGYYALMNIPIDAIPDIGEKQVIVLADWPGRSPQDVEDQVTYPLTTTLSGTPGVKSIRSFSGFGFSMVFIIFKDDIAIRTVPEVKDVVGKVGRAESSLDPAPISMIETIVTLKPVEDWRIVTEDRWHTDQRWLDWCRPALRYFWPEQRHITKAEILAELNQKAAIPGVLPTWLQPIQTRLVMLQTGFRAMMGVKIFGSDLKEIERVGLQMEQLLKKVPGAVDVVADRLVGKPYLEYEIDREAAARYGVGIRDIQDIIEISIGGERLTTTVEGRERYPVRVRYPRELRERFDDLQKILVPTSTGAHVPIAQVAKLTYSVGPQEIKSENGLLVGYATLNTRDRDEISVVEDAERLLQSEHKRSDELVAASKHGSCPKSAQRRAG